MHASSLEGEHSESGEEGEIEMEEGEYEWEEGESEIEFDAEQSESEEDEEAPKLVPIVDGTVTEKKK